MNTDRKTACMTVLFSCFTLGFKSERYAVSLMNSSSSTSASSSLISIYFSISWYFSKSTIYTVGAFYFFYVFGSPNPCNFYFFSPLNPLLLLIFCYGLLESAELSFAPSFVSALFYSFEAPSFAGVPSSGFLCGLIILNSTSTSKLKYSAGT